MVNSGILALVRYWLPPRWLAPFVLLKGECLGQTERVRLEWRGRVRSARGTDGGAVMAARLLMLMLGSLLCAIGGASAAEPKISTSPEVTAGSDVVISCNLTEAPTAIKGHYWMKGETKLDSNDTALDFTSYMIPKVDHQTSGEYHCIFETVPIAKGTVYVKVPPHVVAHKKTEHGGEGDAIMLACKCSSYPTVTQWTWYKVTDEGFQPIVNGTEDRFYITSNKTRTDLWILSLNLEKDPGNYVCNATNQLGDGSAVVDLRVRSRLAALWPFLGIVAEVLVLVTIIFIYEKRRKPNEIPDDDDGGSAPLKGNTANNKDKNVRQRNAN
ncbi:basigin isoform X2 [Candoia aspera]|uniref:basigin isoform X2 n=1 Tax=Candoia aspera TaxID=51853 RepID=UPI002FD82002